MDINELYAFAYVKEPLDKMYSDLASVPKDFILEWFKDKYDYKRTHTMEELLEYYNLTLEEKLQWLENILKFTWEIKRQEWESI